MTRSTAHDRDVWRRVGDLARAVRRELWLYQVCDERDDRGNPKQSAAEVEAHRKMQGFLQGIANRAKRERRRR